MAFEQRTLDEQRLSELLEQSQDLHADSMRGQRALLPDLADAAAEHGSDALDPAQVAQFDEQRRQFATRVDTETTSDAGTGDGPGWVRPALFGGGLGAALVGLLAAPAAAQGKAAAKDLDVACLQTASGLEILAVATYKAALALPFIAQGSPVVVKFAQTTMMQHDEHRNAFQAQTKALGGKKQTQPNAKNLAVVQAATPNLKEPIDVVKLAMTLEAVATNTYLYNMNLLSDPKTASLFGSVQGVECQHLATLRAVAALLEGGAPQLIAIPVDASALPAAAGSVAFPDALAPTTFASDPSEGAL
jgi:hypothetical protein